MEVELVQLRAVDLAGQDCSCIHQNHVLRVRLSAVEVSLYGLCLCTFEFLWRQHTSSDDGQRRQPTEHSISRFELKLPFRLLAPKPNNESIVAEIEKQFTRLDAAVAALKRVQANLKRYRAAVLKAACEGRLVPTEAELARKEGRSYETGEQLLARILKERRAKWEADQLAKMHASGKPPKNDDWKKKYKEPAHQTQPICRRCRMDGRGQLCHR